MAGVCLLFMSEAFDVRDHGLLLKNLNYMDMMKTTWGGSVVTLVVEVSVS